MNRTGSRNGWSAKHQTMYSIHEAWVSTNAQHMREETVLLSIVDIVFNSCIEEK